MKDSETVAVIGFAATLVSTIGAYLIARFQNKKEIEKLKSQYELSNKDKLQERQYEADKKTLKKLWPYISSRNIRQLNDQTQNGYIDSDWYHENIRRFLFEVINKPENRFISTELESAFQIFIDALREYHGKMARAYTSEKNEFTNGEKYVTHSKSIHWGKRPFSIDDLHYHEQEYEKVVDAVLDMKEKHEELVETIKHVVPDFDFDV